MENPYDQYRKLQEQSRRRNLENGKYAIATMIERGIIHDVKNFTVYRSEESFNYPYRVEFRARLFEHGTPKKVVDKFGCLDDLNEFLARVLVALKDEVLADSIRSRVTGWNGSDTVQIGPTKGPFTVDPMTVGCRAN